MKNTGYKKAQHGLILVLKICMGDRIYKKNVNVNSLWMILWVIFFHLSLPINNSIKYIITEMVVKLPSTCVPGIF